MKKLPENLLKHTGKEQNQTNTIPILINPTILLAEIQNRPLHPQLAVFWL